MTVEINRQEADANAETKVLFTIDGTEYSIPTKPRPNLALKVLRAIREGQNMAEAEGDLLVKILGEDGFNALADCDDLTPEQYVEILTEARNTALGGLEEATKN